MTSDELGVALTGPQAALVERLARERKLDDSAARQIARTWIDPNDGRYDLSNHAHASRVVSEFLDRGFSSQQTAEWMGVLLDAAVASFYANHGWTPEQFGAVAPQLCGRELSSRTDHPEGDWSSWVDLVATVPPAFLIKCLQAQPKSDAEIREWDQLRLSGDLQIEAQLDTLRALYGPSTS